MKIRLITIGKMRAGPHTDIAYDYAKRIGHYAPFFADAVRDEKEAERKVHRDEYLIICDERGKEITSVGLAELIQKHQLQSTKSITFVIGGADGFTEDFRRRANIVLSMSKFTLQHDLAAIVLLEQIYRAFTIIKGEPYHR